MINGTRSTLWTSRPLGECGKWVSGGTPRKSDASLWNGDIPWFSAKSLKTFDLDDADDRVTREGAESGSTLVPPGTVLFVVRGMSLANELRVGITSRESTLNQDLRGIIVHKDIDARYLGRFLKHTNAFIDKVDNASHGTKRIQSDKLKEMEIPLPPFSEQRRLADILDKADAIRRKRFDALSSHKVLAASAFDEMFSEEMGSPKRSDLAAHIQELRYGTSTKSSSIGTPTLRIPNVVRGVVNLDNLKLVPVSESEVGKLALIDGDVLFVRTNGNPEYVGRSAIYYSKLLDVAKLSTNVCVYASYLIRARLNDSLNPEFLQAYLETAQGRHALRERCRTSAGQYNINTKDLASLPIPVVSPVRQRKFEDIIRTMQPIRDTAHNAATATERLFQTLVQHAFRGEL